MEHARVLPLGPRRAVGSPDDIDDAKSSRPDRTLGEAGELTPPSFLLPLALAPSHEQVAGRVVGPVPSPPLSIALSSIPDVGGPARLLEQHHVAAPPDGDHANRRVFQSVVV